MHRLGQKLNDSNCNIAIIQARMGSTRLPAKVLADILGRPMLLRVVDRALDARLIDKVVVATSTLPADDPIATLCRENRIDCFRGDESDVLRRYADAARHFEASLVTRITSDCPLLDPYVTDRVIEAFRQSRRGDETTGADYASNTLRRTWPRGLDTEVFTVDAILKADREAQQPYQRTHVTPYIYENPEQFRLLPFCGNADWSHLRWTVDTPEDLELIRAVYRQLPDDSTDWCDAADIVTRDQELSAINTHIRQKETHEG